MIGQTLAHYKVLEKIGSGGMGDVYLAEDTKLDRKVALKVLPPELAESEERRARFKREAKALAALDHPNIVQVFSVEEAEGIHFITMQLVHGKTLTELLPKNGFPLSKFFEIAIPLADAVAAAHQEGITHRDLKPDNMMLGDDGRIKVLDFGLAKPTGGFVGGEADSALPTVAKTAEGVIVGTLNYMSPEQAQGKSVDTRSDIFSLGVVFYEMLTGRRPFEGENPAEILASIIKDTPDSVSDLNRAVPRDLSKIVKRCLAKEPIRRYQSVIDLRIELEETKQDVESGDVSGPGLPRVEGGRRSRSLWFGAGIAALVFIAWVSGMFRSPVDEPVGSAVPRLANPVQVTSVIGREDGPTWSADGRALAYHSDQGGNWDIWISQVDGGQPLNRTADHEGTDQYPSWSPNGTQIAFESDRGGGGIFVMPVFAGPPHRVSQPGTLARGRPQWSSDGAELAYEVRESGQSFAEITSLATSKSRGIELPGVHLMRPHLSWSPRGRFFAYLDVDQPGNIVNQLMMLSVADGRSFPITMGDTHELAPSWSRDERALYFVSTRVVHRMSGCKVFARTASRRATRNLLPRGSRCRALLFPLMAPDSPTPRAGTWRTSGASRYWAIVSPHGRTQSN